MILDVALLNTQHYKVRIKWSNQRKGVLAIEKGTFGSTSTKVANFTSLSTLMEKYVNYKVGQ